MQGRFAAPSVDHTNVRQRCVLRSPHLAEDVNGSPGRASWCIQIPKGVHTYSAIHPPGRKVACLLVRFLLQNSTLPWPYVICPTGDWPSVFIISGSFCTWDFYSSQSSPRGGCVPRSLSGFITWWCSVRYIAAREPTPPRKPATIEPSFMRGQGSIRRGCFRVRDNILPSSCAPMTNLGKKRRCRCATGENMPKITCNSLILAVQA